MSNTKRSIVKDIEAMGSIKDFIVAHEEIAANNMRRIRDAVVSRRDFLKELTTLYNEIKASYKKEFEELTAHVRDPNKAKLNYFKKNSKTACVFFSTNTGLYGDIVKTTYALYKDYLKREKADAVVIGKTGKKILEEDAPGLAFAYFDFPDTSMDNELLKPIVLDIIQYEKVIIFHSKFQTLLHQTPTAFVISENELDSHNNDSQLRYIFEPSLEKIIEFFEKEIFSSIFEQTMRESHLSKFASRMVTLDAASENIKRNLSNLFSKKRHVEHQLENKAQLNSLSRMVLSKRV